MSLFSHVFVVLIKKRFQETSVTHLIDIWQNLSERVSQKMENLNSKSIRKNHSEYIIIEPLYAHPFQQSNWHTLTAEIIF